MLLVSLAMAGTTSAPAQVPSADAVAKAKFIVSLSRLSQWPAESFDSPQAPLHVCVVQDSPALAQALAQVVPAQINGRSVAVQAAATDRDRCHLVFVDESAAHRAEGFIRHRQPDTLTVGAVEGFVSRGGMVELIRTNDALQFDVDLAVLQRAGIHLPPGVLKLARKVKP